MRNLGITGQLAGAFGLLLVMVVGLGGFGLSRTAMLNELLLAVGATALPAVETLGQLDAMAAKIRIAEARQQGVSQASLEAGEASGDVLGAAEGLSAQAERLRGNVDEFLATVRAA